MGQHIGHIQTVVYIKLMSISGCSKIGGGGEGAVCSLDPALASNCILGLTCDPNTATCTKIPNYCTKDPDCKYSGLKCDTTKNLCVCDKIGRLCSDDSVCMPQCGGIPQPFSITSDKYPQTCFEMKGSCDNTSIQGDFGGQAKITAAMQGLETGKYILYTTDGQTVTAKALKDWTDDLPGTTPQSAVCYYDYTKPAKKA